MTHSHLSLFDLTSDATILEIEEAVRQYITRRLGRTDVYLMNFANRCRAELQHRQAERLRIEDLL
jgi:ribosome-associated translation inhibitor RaiA